MLKDYKNGTHIADTYITHFTYLRNKFNIKDNILSKIIQDAAKLFQALVY